MLYREIIAVCSQIHTKNTNTLCGQNVELLNVKAGSAYSNHWVIKGSTQSVTPCIVSNIGPTMADWVDRVWRQERGCGLISVINKEPARRNWGRAREVCQGRRSADGVLNPELPSANQETTSSLLGTSCSRVLVEQLTVAIQAASFPPFHYRVVTTLLIVSQLYPVHSSYCCPSSQSDVF